MTSRFEFLARFATAGLLMLLTVASCDRVYAQDPATSPDHWAPLRPMIGVWEGQRTGMGGDANMEVEWKFVMGENFIRVSSKTIEGDDPHGDVGFISFDQARQQFVYRAFFSEGFVNQYAGTMSDDGKSIEFESESVENGPPGLRAKEVISLHEGGGMQTQLHLASGDQPFKLCVTVDLTRQD
ncbi:MAG: heme-binding beta-barrel domain-containing protein [Pirellulaceae bacterium]